MILDKLPFDTKEAKKKDFWQKLLFVAPVTKICPDTI